MIGNNDKTNNFCFYTGYHKVNENITNNQRYNRVEVGKL